VRRRIRTAIVGTTAAAVIVFGMLLGVAVGRLHHRQEATRLAREAARAAAVVPATGLRGNDPIELPRVDRGTRLALYDVTGERVAGMGPRTSASAVQAALRGRISESRSDGWMAVAVPVLDEEQVVGAARASVRLSVVTSRTTRSWMEMGALGALVVGLAALIARSQARRLAQPVADLASAVSELGAGDFSVRARRHGVTELDSAAAALDATAERLGQLIERERAFSTDASHQLFTPLTGLRLTLESGLDGATGNQRRTMEEALVEVDRLQKTVDDLLRLARNTGSRSILDLGSLVTEAQDRWHGVLAERGRPLRISAPEDLPPLRGSGAAVRQILEVLMDNAVSHGQGTVALRIRTVGEGASIEVSDEGPGVSQDPDVVFSRRAPDATGHGIGLALARSLAEADGARLVIRKDHPSTFALVLCDGDKD